MFSPGDSAGGCFDKLLCGFEKRQCRLVGHQLLGVKLGNGTYTGVLGEFQSGRADIYIRGEPSGIVERWLGSSNPFKTENIAIWQPITDRETFNAFDLSQNFMAISAGIIFSYSATLVVIGLFCLFLNRFQGHRTDFTIKRKEDRQARRRTVWSKANRFLTFLLKNQLTSFRLFSLFASLFFWLSLLFLTSTIKTNKTILDTSFLVKNNEDLLKTEKTFCWTKEGAEQIIAMSLPRQAVLSKLFYEKSFFRSNQREKEQFVKGDKCLIERKLADLRLVGSPEQLFVASESEGLLFGQRISTGLALVKPYLLSLNTLHLNINKFWLLDRNLFEYQLVIYFRRSAVNNEWMQKK